MFWVPAVVSTPADVIKTRLMNQDPSNPAYRGMLHCFTATLRTGGRRGGTGEERQAAARPAVCWAGLHAADGQGCKAEQLCMRQLITPAPLATLLGAEGLTGLYAGFIPTWSRLAPWQLCFWVSYEQLRCTAGLAGF